MNNPKHRPGAYQDVDPTPLQLAIANAEMLILIRVLSLSYKKMYFQRLRRGRATTLVAKPIDSTPIIGLLDSLEFYYHLSPLQHPSS